MTKKEDAIGWFTMLREKFTGTKYGEYLDMAINALEQQPCEDCISREAALKIFGDVHPMDYNTKAYIADIETLPSVTPKQKMGRWIKYGEIWGGMQAWECSICKNHNDINAVYTKMPYNFCPNCGAKMEVER